MATQIDPLIQTARDVLAGALLVKYFPNYKDISFDELIKLANGVTNGA